MKNFDELLKKIQPEQGSGVESFDKKEFEKQKALNNEFEKETEIKVFDEILDKCLSYFDKAQYSALLDYLYEDPSRISSHEIRAIKFFAEISLNFKPQMSSILNRGGFYDYKKDLIFSESLISLYKKLKLGGIDFFKYTQEIPQLAYSWIKGQVLNKDAFISDEYLKNYIVKIDESFVAVKKLFKDDEEILAHYGIRVLYLKALISKKLKDFDQAKKYIAEYFDKTLVVEDKASNLILIENKEYFEAEELLSNLPVLYGEASAIGSFIDESALLTEDTCGTYSCSDCCKHTYPSLSVTEFEYIKAWAKENDFDFSDAIENAKKIQDDYKKKTGKVFKIEDQEEGLDLNPEEFKFPCPFLKEDRCSVHPVRPLLCRVFGSGSNDGNYLKTCNFYLNQYQYFSSPENERLVYDSRNLEKMIHESDKYLTGSNKAKTGLIPAYLMDLSQNSQEN